MNKLINFLRDSNHWLHIVGGTCVYLAMLPLAACYAALVAVVLVAASLELKDKLYGNKWDVVDFLCTIAVPLVAFVLELTLS